jgi:hypothetical protein
VLSVRERVFNAASGYGLASGLLFGISAVCYRGATLSLPDGDAVLRAGVALLAATGCADGDTGGVAGGP